jgi:hypothetical protein
MTLFDRITVLAAAIALAVCMLCLVVSASRGHLTLAVLAAAGAAVIAWRIRITFRHAVSRRIS